MGQIMLNGNAYGGINGPSVGDRIVVIPTFESGAKLADIVINNETTSIYMPSGGTINDIQVNNVSVVDQYGVGKIDLSLYQLILTPGQYLSINNNTISTTFGIFQGATTSSSGTYGLVPAPSTADKELFLKGNGTWSELPASGRTIIANPETVPTDNLTKILIDNTTYAVAATDEKVTQTETTTDADYELLFSETADDTTRTEGSRKSENLLYNPNDITLTVGATTGMTIDGDNGDINLIGSGDTWDGTYTSLKDAIANAGGGGGTSDLDAVELTQAEYDALTPEQKTDEDKIYFIKDGGSSGGGGGGTNTVLLTKAEYDALTTAQKNNGSIYFVYATADQNYEYRICKDGQIIVQRNKTTGDVTWWFIGYSNGGNDWQFPQDMQNYDWMPTSNLIFGVSYDSDKVTQNANIGVYNGYAREWSIDLASLVGYTTWGVVTNSGGTGQNNPWSEPPDTNTENAIYFMNKKFSSYDINS